MSFQVNGEEWLKRAEPKVDLEAGSAELPVSTVVLRFRPQTPLPAVAGQCFSGLRLSVSTELATPDGKRLMAPFAADFESAGGLFPRPRIAQVVPRVGPVGGGSILQILGEGFTQDVKVRIGGVDAVVLPSAIHDSTRLTVKTPKGVPGLADVEVINYEPGCLSGLSDRRPGGFLYKSPLWLSNATPRFLDARGGSRMEITGDGFLPAWAYGAMGAPVVKVGGVDALAVSVASTGLLNVEAPPGSFGANGFADVTVSTTLPDNRGADTADSVPEPPPWWRRWATAWSAALPWA